MAPFCRRTTSVVGSDRSRGAAINTWRWIDTVTRQLELCGVTPDETVTVLATDTNDAELRTLFALALERLECTAIELVVRSAELLHGGDPVDNGAVAAALLHSDLVIDLGRDLVERSMAREEILDEARVIAIDVDTPHDLDHLTAHPGLAKRVDRAVEILDEGSSMRIGSLAGTSLRADLEGAAVSSASGLASAVGDLVHWPGGAVWAQASAIDGTIVAMPGDMLSEARHLLRSPVRLEVTRGKLVEVLGETVDADVVRSYLEGLDHDDAYTITMIGWGMNLTHGASSLARFDPLRLAAGRGPLTAGLVNLRIGGPGQHGITLSLADASATVDNLDVVIDGSLHGTLAPDVYERAAGC